MDAYTDNEVTFASLEAEAGDGSMPAAIMLENAEQAARGSCACCGATPAGNAAVFRLTPEHRERLGIVEAAVNVLFPVCDRCGPELAELPHMPADVEERVLRSITCGASERLGVTFRTGWPSDAEA